MRHFSLKIITKTTDLLGKTKRGTGSWLGMSRREDTNRHRVSLQLKIAQQDQHEEEDEEDVTASGAVRVLLIDSISLYNSSGGVQEDHFPIAVK